MLVSPFLKQLRLKLARESQSLASTRCWYKESNHSVSVFSLKRQQVHAVTIAKYYRTSSYVYISQGEMCAEGKVAQRAEIQPIASKAYLDLKKLSRILL